MNSDYTAILKTAINNEIEAYEFYNHAVTVSKDPNVRAVFAELAGEEMKHKKTLEGFLNNPALQLHFQVGGSDYKIAESVELPKLTPGMSFTEGVALAIKKEQEAMEMYGKFAQSTSDPGQKAVFTELAKMEQGHKVKLEELYTNSAYNDLVRTGYLPLRQFVQAFLSFQDRTAKC